MADEMGIFRAKVGIESHNTRGVVEFVEDVLVDTGADTTWVPGRVLEAIGISRERTVRYRLSDGRVVTRDIGYAFVHAGAPRPLTKSFSRFPKTWWYLAHDQFRVSTSRLTW